MPIDKPGGGDATPDRPRSPEFGVPRPDNPAARVRSPSVDPDAPVAREDRAGDAEKNRLERIARRSADSSPPETEAPRPGGKGVITHVHSEFHGQSLDLYTDGTRWVSGDAFSVKQEERPDLATDRPPTGQDLVDEANEKGSVKDRFTRELWTEGDDVMDVTQNNVDDGHNYFVRKPTGSHEGTPPQGPYIGPQHHPTVDVGIGAAGLLAFGLGIDHVRKLIMKHLGKHAKGDD